MKRIGDVRNVVVEISLDRDGLEWLAYALPSNDGFTKDLMTTLDEVMAEEETQAEEPGLSVRLVLTAPNPKEPR